MTFDNCPTASVDDGTERLHGGVDADNNISRQSESGTKDGPINSSDPVPSTVKVMTNSEYEPPYCMLQKHEKIFYMLTA